jgi:anti-sigma B factor antagonist
MSATDTQGVIALAGRLEIKDVERVQTQLLEALGAPHADGALAIDLSGLESVDTAGVQLLLAAKREAARSGLRLVYRGESRELRGVLELLGLREAVLGREAA